jgi:hypothetical protein
VNCEDVLLPTSLLSSARAHVKAMNGKTPRILRFLFGDPFDMSREIALRLHVQIVPGHGAVNVDRAGERFCDLRQ